MKAFLVTLAAAATLLLVAGIAVADPDQAVEKKREIKILTDADSEPTVIDVEADLALGETREYLTGDGKSVTVTRSLDDEIEVSVDGKVIAVPLEGEGRHRLIETLVGGEEGDGRQVRKVIVGGDGVDGGTELDVEVLRLASEDLDCAEGESQEDCEARAHTRIIELLGDEGDGGETEVIVIKKRHRVEGDEASDGEGGS